MRPVLQIERALRDVPPELAPPVKRALRWGRAWVPTAKAAALFALPVPLLFATLGGLIAGDVARAGLALGGVAALWGAGVLVAGALAAEARYLLGERPEPPALPLKLLSAVITALGAAFAALAAGHGVAAVGVFAALGGAGHAAFFGRDLRPPRIRVAVVDGVDVPAVTLQLQQAHGRLRGVEAAARSIAVPEFRERLARITAIGRSILGELERRPGEAPRARRFLNLYLDSAERVTAEYARTHRQMRSRPLEKNFRQLLADMEHAFAEQHRRLVERDLVSLDVDIEVLNARLRREGIG